MSTPARGLVLLAMVWQGSLSNAAHASVPSTSSCKIWPRSPRLNAVGKEIPSPFRALSIAKSPRGPAGAFPGRVEPRRELAALCDTVHCYFMHAGACPGAKMSSTKFLGAAAASLCLMFLPACPTLHWGGGNCLCHSHVMTRCVACSRCIHRFAVSGHATPPGGGSKARWSLDRFVWREIRASKTWQVSKYRGECGEPAQSIPDSAVSSTAHFPSFSRLGRNQLTQRNCTTNSSR